MQVSDPAAYCAIYPGMGSAVARGISAILGLIVFFGSTSMLGNHIARIVLTYMRRFQPGDRVEIGNATGRLSSTSSPNERRTATPAMSGLLWRGASTFWPVERGHATRLIKVRHGCFLLRADYRETSAKNIQHIREIAREKAVDTQNAIGCLI